jgi:hypothetical protein
MEGVVSKGPHGKINSKIMDSLTKYILMQPYIIDIFTNNMSAKLTRQAKKREIHLFEGPEIVLN